MRLILTAEKVFISTLLCKSSSSVADRNFCQGSVRTRKNQMGKKTKRRKRRKRTKQAKQRRGKRRKQTKVSKNRWWTYLGSIVIAANHVWFENDELMLTYCSHISFAQGGAKFCPATKITITNWICKKHNLILIFFVSIPQFSLFLRPILLN